MGRRLVNSPPQSGQYPGEGQPPCFPWCTTDGCPAKGRYGDPLPPPMRRTMRRLNDPDGQTVAILAVSNRGAKGGLQLATASLSVLVAAALLIAIAGNRRLAKAHESKLTETSQPEASMTQV